MSISRAPQSVALALLVVTCLSIPFAHAKPGERGGKRGGPPPEALEVCANQTEGAACSFSGRRGDVEGTCIVLPQGEEQLACAPAGGPPEREQG